MTSDPEGRLLITGERVNNAWFGYLLQRIGQPALETVQDGFVAGYLAGEASRAPVADDIISRLELTSRAYAECAEERKSLQEQVYALQERLAECDEGDSAALREMLAVIDDRNLWRDAEQEEAGDYQGRMVEIAGELEQWLRLVNEENLSKLSYTIACLRRKALDNSGANVLVSAETLLKLLDRIAELERK